jgi:RNA polymerase sigma-70 factor, ECF subfamily
MDGMICALSKVGIDRMAQRGVVGADDLALVERVKSGDLDAFSAIVDKYQNRIYSAVLNYVYNSEDAYDITQDAFVKAYSNLNRFNSSSAFYTWLYRIAINTAIDALRKRKSRPVESLEDDKITQTGFEPVGTDIADDPERSLANRELARHLQAAIGSLSNKLRSVIVLHDVEGLSQEEVAQIIGVPVGTVKSRVSRARAEIRRHLENSLGGQL